MGAFGAWGLRLWGFEGLGAFELGVEGFGDLGAGGLFWAWGLGFRGWGFGVGGWALLGFGGFGV